MAGSNGRELCRGLHGREHQLARDGAFVFCRGFFLSAYLSVDLSTL